MAATVVLTSPSQPAHADGPDFGPQARPADQRLTAVYDWSIQSLDQVFIDIHRPPVNVRLAYTLDLWRTPPGSAETELRLEVRRLALLVNDQPVYTHPPPQPPARGSAEPDPAKHARDAFHRLVTNTSPLLEFTDAARYEIEALARLLTLAHGRTFTLNTASPLWAPDPEQISTDAFIAALAPEAVSPIPSSLHYWYFNPDDQSYDASRRVFLPHHARVRSLFYNHLKLLMSAHEANGPLPRLDRRLFLDSDGPHSIPASVRAALRPNRGVSRATPNPVPAVSPLIALGIIPTADQFTTLEIDRFGGSNRNEAGEQERARLRRRLITDIRHTAHKLGEPRLLSDARRGKLPTLDGPAAVRLASRLRIAELRRYRIARIREDPELDIAALYLQATDRKDLWLTASRAVTHRASRHHAAASVHVTAEVPSSPTIRAAPFVRARLRILASLTWQPDLPIDLSADRWIDP
ncbi:MAG: hypothetical protein AAGI68_11375 [Planctomycetota bacterium]